MKKLEIIIPFAGFYNSEHDYNLDNGFNYLFSDDRGDVIESIRDKAFDRVPWSDIHIEYSKDYLEAFAENFEIGSLEFKSLISPKYYNYSTDRILALIDYKDLQKISANITDSDLEKSIKENFTSYDGFISHYSNDLDDWRLKDLEDYDHNESGLLLSIYCNKLDDNWHFDPCDSCINYFNNINDPIFNKCCNVINYLYQRKLRA